MHIKQIVLVGFKSYRDHTEVYDIDPGLNVIVGKNGTGKSNIFNAICYVLDDGDTSNMRNSVVAQRGQECFVELIFDNSDQRFLTFDDEVSIRRSLDSPNDFWMNGKKTPKTDVLNYLESAGFGRFNPFYVVPQGKVASLIQATEEERLQLLLTASGLDLFERKKSESQKTINKSLKDIDHIEATLQDMNARLETLEEEINVSQEYRAADLEQRELNFERLKREQTVVNAILEQCSQKLSTLRETETATDAQLNAAQERQSTLEAKVAELKCEIDTLSAQIDFHQRPGEDANANNTQEVGAYDELAAEAAASIAANMVKLEKVKADISKTQGEFADVSSKLRVLQVKKAQGSKFGSKQERDEWLKEEAVRVDSDIVALKENMKLVKAELDGINVPTVSTESIDSIRDKLATAKDEVREEQRKLAEAQSNLKILQLERRKNHILIENLDEQIQAVVQSSSDTLLVDVVGAIEQAKKCAQDLGLSDKFYGPLANLMKIDSTYAVAAEAIAKSALFYCVVEDSETVRIISKEMADRKAGRLSFIPLQQINSKELVELEPSDQEEAALLIDMIECDDKFRPAVSLIVGSALLCADIDISWRCSRAYNVDCVTLEGNLVSPYGALHGGSKKSRNTSRFDALAAATSIYSKKEEARAKITDADSEINRAQQFITSAHNSVSKVKQQVTTIFGELEEARREYARDKSEVDTIEQQRQYKKDQLSQLQSDYDDSSTRKQALIDGLEADFVGQLDGQETSELLTFTTAASELQIKKDALLNQFSSLERAIKVAEGDKWDALLARERISSQSQFEQEMPEDDTPGVADIEKSREQKIELRADLRLQLQAAITEVTETAALLFKLQKELKKQEFREEKYADLLKDNKKQQRKLGFSESSAFENLTDAELEEQLQEIQSRINRCGPINQFAEEQHDKFKHEYSEHVKQREEISQELADSQAMIAKLDAYKSKAILKTFREVEKRFSSFFKRLTRTDNATLHVQGTEPLEWTGLEITVSFARHRQLKIEQLSGGQKALCALAFLLSLQASDPAPFYIFDEVDASLDAQYRGSLADTLKQISSQLGAQFICTTFGPELVRNANKVYGTAFASNTSSISEITKEMALTLVDVSSLDVENVLG